MQPHSPPILVLCRDLLFVSKITAAAQAGGVVAKIVRDAAKLQEHVDARRLIVDLGQSGFLDAAAQWKRRTGGHVTGFVSHVDAETILRAKSEGLDVVVSRGQFVADLPSLLSII